MAKVDIDAKLKGKRLLHVSMLATLPVYAALATIVAQTRDSSVNPIPMPELATEPLSQPLFLALAAVSVVVLAATPFIRMKMMPPRSYGGQGGGDVKAALQRLLLAELVSWALTETIGICGLVLTLLSNEPIFTYAFGGVSFLAMLAYAPSHKVMDEVVRVASS